jgi:hypothetical protein
VKHFPGEYLLIFALTGTLLGCAVAKRPVSRFEIDQLGHFEYSEPEPDMSGVVIGAPHGGTVPETAELARLISERTGAGFVAAYGFKSKRISVERPVVRSQPYQPVAREPAQRRSVFAELKQILRRVTHGNLDLYVGIRHRPAAEPLERLQVIASGFTYEEAEIIKRSYISVRDRVIGSREIDRLPIAVDPLEGLSWQAPGIVHHGVLLVAEKGLGLRIPEKFLGGANLRVYGEILAAWVQDIERLIRDNSQLVPQVEVTLTDLGRFDLIPSRKGIAGLVVGAPHGTYDEYTAELVKQLGYRTGLAAVIARGFTPTETGGWRINVNRPSEKNDLAPEFEVNSSRARKVYQAFKEIVLDAAGGDLRLYFDVHQYGVDSMIQIATVGLDSRQALGIKRAYQRIRDRLFVEDAGIDKVELLIEPVDKIEIGAWPAKYRGILGVARKGLHIEMPLHTALRSKENRDFYTRVMAELIKFVQQELPD